MATYITHTRAQQLCSDWHGGQWSPLYQFASSGSYLMENHLLYLEEIVQEINRPETALKPFHRSKKQTGELKSLLRYFEMQGEKHGIKTAWDIDPYKIVPLPTLLHPVANVKPIKRLL